MSENEWRADALSNGKKGQGKIHGPRPGARRSRGRDGDMLDRVLEAPVELWNSAMGHAYSPQGEERAGVAAE